MTKVKNIAKLGGKVLGKVALPLTIALSAFDVYSTETDETMDRTEKNIAHSKTGAALAGAAAGAAIGSVVPFVGTLVGGIIGGGLGYFLAGEIGETVAEQVSDKTNIDANTSGSKLANEDKQWLMKQAEQQGIVDTGMGHGTIDDLEKLSKLDVDSLESLLDTETWGKADKQNIMDLVAAKKMGKSIKYDSGGLFGDETLAYGEAGSVGPTKAGDEIDNMAKMKKTMKKKHKLTAEYEGDSEEMREATAGLDKKKFMQKGELDGIPGTWLHDKGMWAFHSDEKVLLRRSKAEIAQREKVAATKAEDPGTGTTRLNADGTVAENQGPEIVKDPGKFEYGKHKTYEKDSDKLEVTKLTPEKFDELTPKKELQDSANTAMVTTGSIFTHDTHLEQTLWDIWAEQKPFFDITSEGTVGVEGEKELPLTMLPDGESTEFKPQMNMFGNAGELTAPVPVIDVGPSPMMGAEAEMLSSSVLEQQKADISTAEKQAVSGPSASQIIDAKTIDNSVSSQTIMSDSSAHSPGVPAGTGRG